MLKKQVTTQNLPGPSHDAVSLNPPRPSHTAISLNPPGPSHAAVSLNPPGPSHAAASLNPPGPSHAAVSLNPPGLSHAAVSLNTLTAVSLYPPGPSHAAVSLNPPGPPHMMPMQTIGPASVLGPDTSGNSGSLMSPQHMSNASGTDTLWDDIASILSEDNMFTQQESKPSLMSPERAMTRYSSKINCCLEFLNPKHD